MGNTCVGPSAAGRNGFLANVTLWRPRGDDPAPAPALPPPPSPASDKAPDPVTIPESEHSSHHSSRSTDLPPAPASQPQDNPTAKKPAPKVKRVQSAGLLADSVLKRDVNTARLKDIYTIGKKLGQGQFGTTYLCVEKATGREFACKSIAKRKLLTEEDVEDVRREIQIMHHLAGHANVVSIVGAYEDAVAVQLVMELCAGGELFDRIIQRGHYSEKAAAQLTRVIVGVVEACHSLGVMHRDLKPENFLFVNQKEDSPLKTIDFGLSIFFKPVELITVATIAVIAESLSEEEIAGLKEMFKMIDSDNSGHITLEELKTGLQRVGANLMDSEINALMEAADIDNSGTIDYGEFIAATLHINKVEKEDKLFAAFSYFDKDGSGYITQDELQKACEEFGLGDTRLEDIIGDIDQDNDGRIDYNEFVAMMQKGDNPLGRKGHQSNTSFGLGDALKLRSRCLPS
ncbi:Calcium-dependent protein kinase 20 [Zea mays]|uniref:non-specific serine/threonine protein kinase n=2 Tax=Zea mays TaxID=4577 RepID=A0A1D6L700_MAIZE|nr:Calcium-dependent protein kinase 20 [Zea mays]